MPLTIPAGLSGGSALPVAVAYAATIPLDGNKTMARAFVSGATTFTAGATTNGGQCILPLIADGSSVITFQGFTEAGTSAGYRNSSGILNLIQFFYLDNTPYFSVSQAINAQPIYQAATAYTLSGPSSATVGNASSNYTVTSNGTLASAVIVTPSDGGAGGTFTPATATLASNSSGTSSATFTYTPSSAGTKTISTTNGGGLTNPAALSLTASAAAVVKYLRLTGLSGLTEAANGSGYNYTPVATDNYASGYGVSSVAIPANSDGYFGGTNKLVTEHGPIIGLGTGSGTGNFGQSQFAIYVDTLSSANWSILTGGNYSASTVPIAAGDVARMRRSGTTIIGEVSKDGGGTWTTVNTWTGVTTAALYGHYQVSFTGNVLVLPFSSSNAA